MNYKMIGRMSAWILAVEAVFMLPAMALCFFDGQPHSAFAFLYTIGIILLLDAALWLLSRGAKHAFYARDGLTCVGISWVLMSVVGCLPMFFSGAIPNFIDALFEIVSGFTTTGASILREVESLPRGILYWRSFTHWLGGMGVLVFLLAILPGSGSHGGSSLHLLRAESPGPDVGKLVPKMRQTALILYLMYIALTVLDFIFLLIGKMPLFDAICTAFGTAGTGGFGIRNDSLASYTPFARNVTTIFLFFFGVNFSCYYLLLMRRVKAVLKDEELHAYVGVILASVAIITVNLMRNGFFATVGETLHHSFFQVLCIITTAGYSSTDFNAWPTLSKAILLCLMAMGACAGSTGGGMKVSRILLLLKSGLRSIRQVIHPQRVQVVKMNGKAVDEKILAATNTYLAVYAALFVVSFLVISIDGFSLMTNFSSVMSCMNNIGPGFEQAFSNMADFSPVSKLVLIFDMLAGRLELYPMLVLFLPATWKRK